jgi:hypothetical protein
MNGKDFRLFGHTAQIILLVSAVIALGAGEANADVLFNTHFENTTGNVANDYHIKMVADENITIDATFESGGDVVFDDALTTGGVQGNGTQSVTINWSGATVNPGQTVHVGAGTGIGGGTPNNLRITESWWTVGLVKMVSDTLRCFASADFNGTAGSGDWVVVQLEIFDDIEGTNLIGRQWIEGRGTSAVITNETYGRSIFARWAFNTPSPDMIPLEDLNEDLGGFGSFGPIVELAPAVPTLTEWGLMVLALLLLTAACWMLWRRRKVAAA